MTCTAPRRISWRREAHHLRAWRRSHSTRGKLLDFMGAREELMRWANDVIAGDSARIRFSLEC